MTVFRSAAAIGISPAVMRSVKGAISQNLTRLDDLIVRAGDAFGGRVLNRSVVVDHSLLMEDDLLLAAIRGAARDSKSAQRTSETALALQHRINTGMADLADRVVATGQPFDRALAAMADDVADTGTRLADLATTRDGLIAHLTGRTSEPAIRASRENVFHLMGEAGTAYDDAMRTMAHDPQAGRAGVDVARDTWRHTQSLLELIGS